MKLIHKQRSLPILAALATFGLSQQSEAQIETHNLTEFQTIDANGLFPANDVGNINSFGSAAPFATTAYVRSATNGAQVPRRVKLFLQFDLSTLTTDEITTATLDFSAYSLNDRMNDANNPTLFVSQLTDDWAPDIDPAPIFQPTLTVSVDGGGVTSGTGSDHFFASGTPEYRNITPYSIDVTNIIQNIQNGDTNNGFILELDDAAGGNASNHAQGLGIDQSTLVLKVVTGNNPLATLSTESTTASIDYIANINFSEDVTGLEASDFNVSNGTASSLTGSGSSYSMTITPSGGGDIELTLPEDSVNAVVGGLGNFESNTLITTFVPPAQSTVTLSTALGLNDNFTVDVIFNEEVSGLEIADFTITNGTAVALEGAGDNYTLEVNSNAPGTVEVTLPADSVTDLNDGLSNLVSNTLTVVYDPAASALSNLINADLNSTVSVIPNTGSGAFGWSFDSVANRVLFNGQTTSARANQWVWSSLTRGFAYDPDGGANGAGDGAFVQTAVNLVENPRAVLYFVDDNKLTTGLVNFGLDAFFDDNSEDNPLQFIVEVYAWDDNQIAPSLSAGGPTPNDPNYNLTDLGEAVSILQAQVIASDIDDATWQTSALGSAIVGDGYDNYVWRIGILGATDDDFFAFDNVTTTMGMVAPVITSITREGTGEVDLEFTSASGNVDVYRSTDLQDFGASPIAVDVESGSYLDTTAVGLPKAFYVLVPTGTPAP